MRELANEPDRDIRELQAAVIEDARARIRAIADTVGVPLEEFLLAVAPSWKARVGRACYANPDNPEQDACGWGRMPGSLMTWLEQGRALEDLRA